MTAKLRVLVVDDVADAAESMARVLCSMGHEAAFVTRASEALEVARKMRPVAVFLDLGMPDMDGYELARRIRALPGGERIKLIALTGWSQERDRRRTQDAGFDDHLVKPAGLDVIRSLLG